MPSNQTEEANENRTDVTSRRRILQALGAASAIGIAGCAGGDDDGTPTDPGKPGDGTATATPTATASLQDSIVISLGYEPNITNDFWRNLYGINPYHTNVLEPLTWATEDLRPEPWLATDWERTGDRTWVFTLREGVRFHNGEVMTSEAVEFFISEMYEKWGYAGPFLRLDGPESVQAIDETTVEFTTIEPIGNYPAAIAHNMVAVQHPDANTKETKPIGTGPFRLVDIEPDQHATVRKFDDYWRDEDPNVSEITYRVIGDANTRSLALQNHEIDVAFNPPRSKVNSLRQADETELVTQQKPEVAIVAVNIYKPPTDDIRLRRALNYAVDQEVLVETVLENIGQPARGPISPMIYWSAHDDLPAYGPDRTEATRLVEASSYDGEKLRLILTPGTVEGSTIAETLQQWFTDIGVTTDIQVLESGTRFDQWSNGQAHLNLTDPGTNSAAADYLLFQQFHREGSHNATMYEKEGTGVMNLGEEVNRLIDEGRGTTDEATKTEKYREVQQRVMDQAVVVPLYYFEYIVGTYKDVSGLDLHPIAQMTRWPSLTHHEL